MSDEETRAGNGHDDKNDKNDKNDQHTDQHDHSS
jgi:hypothetical protein